MPAALFDQALVPLRRARAQRMGGDYFLHERAFDECLERIVAIRRRFDSAVLFGDARPGWGERLMGAGVGRVAELETMASTLPDRAPNLCLSIGALDTAEELPALLATIRHRLAPDGLFIGAFAGGDSLPMLRTAMQAADRASARPAAPHVHPRIDAASFAALLGQAGFVEPVVDVDRISLRYSTFDSLIRDLRAMGATNRMIARSRVPVLRAGLEAARSTFASRGHDGRTTETIEILQFLAWSPKTPEIRASAQINRLS